MPFWITITLGLIQSIAEFVFINKLKNYSFHGEIKTGNRTVALFRRYLNSSEPEFRRKYRKEVLPFLILTLSSFIFTFFYVLSKFI